MTAPYKVACFVILCVFNLLVYLPPIIFYLTQYYSHRKNSALHKRYTPYIITFNLSLIIYIGIVKPVHGITTTFHIDEESGVEVDSAISIVGLILAIAAGRAVIFLNIARQWALYYDIQWSVANKEGEWIQHLHDVNNSSENWFILNRRTLGNSPWMVKVSFLFAKKENVRAVAPFLENDR